MGKLLDKLSGDSGGWDEFKKEAGIDTTRAHEVPVSPEVADHEARVEELKAKAGPDGVVRRTGEIATGTAIEVNFADSGSEEVVVTPRTVEPTEINGPDHEVPAPPTQ